MGGQLYYNHNLNHNHSTTYCALLLTYTIIPIFGYIACDSAAAAAAAGGGADVPKHLWHPRYHSE